MAVSDQERAEWLRQCVGMSQARLVRLLVQPTGGDQDWSDDEEELDGDADLAPADLLDGEGLEEDDEDEELVGAAGPDAEQLMPGGPEAATGDDGAWPGPGAPPAQPVAMHLGAAYQALRPPGRE